MGHKQIEENGCGHKIWEGEDFCGELKERIQHMCSLSWRFIDYFERSHIWS